MFIADHVMEVNDTSAHETGDEVLRMLGQSLVNALRYARVPQLVGT